MCHTLTVPSAEPEARYVDVGSATQMCTGASCARLTTRMGGMRFLFLVMFLVSVVVFRGCSVLGGSSYIRKDRDEVNTRRCEEDGVMQSEFMG